MSNKSCVRCLKCGHEWFVIPSSLINGHGCPKCKGKQHSERTRKPHEDFVAEMNVVNPDIEIISQYYSRGSKVDCRCKICDATWSATARNLLHGTGCPRCFRSKGEKRIEKILQNLNINYAIEYRAPDCKYIGQLRYDFAILNEANDVIGFIEYDGIQHYEPVPFNRCESEDELNSRYTTAKIRDNIKDEYCKNNHIPLLRIPYT